MPIIIPTVTIPPLFLSDIREPCVLVLNDRVESGLREILLLCFAGRATRFSRKCHRMVKGCMRGKIGQGI